MKFISQNQSKHETLFTLLLLKIWIILLPAIFVACHVDSEFENLQEAVATAATEEEWRQWARLIIQNSNANKVEIPRSDWPEFVQNVAISERYWQVSVDDENIVYLTSPGGFESLGIIIGSPDYIDQVDEEYQETQKIFPGIFVRVSR